MKHWEVLGRAPAVPVSSLMLRGLAGTHVSRSVAASLAPWSWTSPVWSEESGRAALQKSAWWRTQASMWRPPKLLETNQPCSQHRGHCQASRESYGGKPWLSWGLAGKESFSFPCGTVAASEQQGWAGRMGMLIWVTSASLGLPEATCDWAVCFLSTTKELQKGQGLAKEALKWHSVFPPGGYFELQVSWEQCW